MNSKNVALLNDAIYYPFIELPNDSWLRTAILFWDTINPIVPPQIYGEMKSDSLLKILESNGAASPVFPYEYFHTENNEELFTESILTYASAFQPQESPENDISIYEEIHLVKMPGRLRVELKKMKLLWDKTDDYDWFYIYRPLADLFMAELARNLANEKKMFPITKSKDSGEHIFGQPISIKKKTFLEKFYEKISINKEEIEINKPQIALDFLIKNILPTPSSKFNIDTLLRIKDDNRELLYRFRNSFRTTAGKINQLQSEEEIYAELQQYSDKIETDNLALKDLFSTYKEDITYSDFGAILSIDKPLNLATKVGLFSAGVAVSPLFLVGLVAFAGFEAYKGRREIKKQMKKSLRDCEGAYIFKVNEELSSYVSEQDANFLETEDKTKQLN